MLVNIKVTGGLNIESGQIDPKATQGLNLSLRRALNQLSGYRRDVGEAAVFLSATRGNVNYSQRKTKTTIVNL